MILVCPVFNIKQISHTLKNKGSHIHSSLLTKMHFLLSFVVRDIFNIFNIFNVFISVHINLSKKPAISVLFLLLILGNFFFEKPNFLPNLLGLGINFVRSHQIALGLGHGADAELRHAAAVQSLDVVRIAPEHLLRGIDHVRPHLLSDVAHGRVSDARHVEGRRLRIGGAVSQRAVGVRIDEGRRLLVRFGSLSVFSRGEELRALGFDPRCRRFLRLRREASLAGTSMMMIAQLCPR
mmetsp:Transcript_5181/g.10486  ORF Transcript_5181/g.10486 Transcript_5181/m.10486 type:complete len:237 (+) Transcript_5181:127-837(+)